jgi:hypothetical protein
MEILEKKVDSMDQVIKMIHNATRINHIFIHVSYMSFILIIIYSFIELNSAIIIIVKNSFI